MPTQDAAITITTGETPNRMVTSAVTASTATVSLSVALLAISFQTAFSTMAQTEMEMPANACWTTTKWENCRRNAAMMQIIK